MMLRKWGGVYGFDVLNVSPEELSDIYLHRVKVYEQMNLLEHAKADYRKILEADPGFIQR